MSLGAIRGRLKRAERDAVFIHTRTRAELEEIVKAAGLDMDEVFVSLGQLGSYAQANKIIPSSTELAAFVEDSEQLSPAVLKKGHGAIFNFIDSI